MRTVLITGGSGYFGTLLAASALARGDRVRTFDLNPPADGSDVEFVQGDVRDRDAVAKACQGVDVVLHNVAQVPLAKDRALFDSVNVGGTANLLVAARAAGVAKVVHTSSSAVFGIPESNPVTEDTPPRPLEAYGRAKLRAEALCREAAGGGLDVTIVRPRTILGHGRLGIMAILFEFVAEGAPVYVLGRSLPAGPASAAMRVVATAGQAPFAPYHWLLYGESLWFDTTKARTELGWEPRASNAEMVIESYEWFLANRRTLERAGTSHHQSPARLGLLRVLKHL